MLSCDACILIIWLNDRMYTAEFKQKVVGLNRSRGRSTRRLPAGWACDVGSLSDWVKRADAADVHGAQLPAQVEAGHARLVDAFCGLRQGFYPRCELVRLVPKRFPLDLAGFGREAQTFIERTWTSGPTKEVALFIGSPFHECGVAAGGLDTAIVGLIRGYACRRGFQLFMSCSYRLERNCANCRVVRVFVAMIRFELSGRREGSLFSNCTKEWTLPVAYHISSSLRERVFHCFFASAPFEAVQLPPRSFVADFEQNRNTWDSMLMGRMRARI